jgi:hypothetical protein
MVSTGGFAAGLWRANNTNAQQLSTSAAAFASCRVGQLGDISRRLNPAPGHPNL